MINLLIAAFLGAAFYRLRGMGAWPNKRLWVVLFALPYAYLAHLAAGWYAAIPVFAITFGMTLTGHASYIDLGSVKLGDPNMPADGQIDEWYGTWIPGSGYMHDFFGLCVNGLLITGSCGIMLLIGGHTLSGIIILASGLLKSTCYAAAWDIAAKTKFSAVMLGEILTGFFFFALAYVAYLHL